MGVSLRPPPPPVSASPCAPGLQARLSAQRGTIIPLLGDEAVWSPGRGDSRAAARVLKPPAREELLPHSPAPGSPGVGWGG